jgi:type I restriction enzyme S subunit
MTQALPKDVPQTLRRWKRYPDYKDSGVEWLGEIPAHWQIKRLKYSLQGGLVNGLFKKKEQFGSGTKLVNVVDLYQHTFTVNFESLERVNAEQQEIEAYQVLPGDIFFVRSSLKLEGVGASACVSKVPEPTVFECHLVRVRPCQKWVLPKYLINYLNASLTRQRLVALAETTTMTTIAQPKLASLEVVVPPLPEQQAIASFLDRETTKIDALIAKKELLIELLQEKRTVIISHAVTKGLDPTVLLKDSGVEWLGKIPEHWEVRKIKNLCSVVKDGLHETPPKVPEGIPFISTQHVRNRYIDLERATFISKDDYEKGHPRIAPSPGDVLITLVGSIGFAAILKPEFYPISFTRHVGYVRPKSNLTANYLLNYVESRPFRTFLDLEVSQTAQPSIYLRSLAEHVIPVPPVDEQNYIVTHLDHETAKIDALIAKIREGIEKLKEYRTALISAAVTGKIDVRNEVTS